MTDTLAARRRSVLETAARSAGKVDDLSGIGLADRFGIGRLVRFRTEERPSENTFDGERILSGLAHTLLMEAAEELTIALTKRDIPHFFVKGIALAGRLYEPGEREMSDIDLHVHPHAKPTALETLKELGYHIPPDEEQSGPAELCSGVFAGRYTESSQLEHVSLDLAWGLDPVVRLLPRPDFAIPDDVWNSVNRTGKIPVPRDSHHLVLLVHHLVHHDMLHFRGLVDLALLWPQVREEEKMAVEHLAADLGVLRATRFLSAMLGSDLGVTVPCAWSPPDDWRGRRARKMLEPTVWCEWALQAGDAEFVEINIRRIRRRLLLLDRLRDIPGLFADAIFPPREYLKWRWPQSGNTIGAWWLHAKRVAAKLA